MAIVLSMVPPFIRGGDPVHAQKYWTSLRDAFNALTKHFEDRKVPPPDGEDDVFLKTFLMAADVQKKYTMFVFKDANKLKRLPIFPVDVRLSPLLNSLQLTHSMLQRMAHLLSILAKDLEKDWEHIISTIKDDSAACPPDDGDGDEESIDKQRIAVEIRTFHRVIRRRLDEDEVRVHALFGIIDV